jgi:FkbM family methyltransferase
MSEPAESRLEKVEQSLERLHNLIFEVEKILETLVTNDAELLEAMAQIVSGLPRVQARNEQSQAKLVAQIRDELRLFTLQLMQQQVPAVALGPDAGPALDEFSRKNPEIGLLQYLYSFLPNNSALDIGANIGDVSEHLLVAGYTVYAFEPNPATFQVLQEKFASEKRVHCFPCAVGSQETTMNLNIAEDPTGAAAAKYGDPSLFSTFVDHPMPGDLPFNKTVSVKVRTLDHLRGAGEIPAQLGLIKIDTEGFDLEVLRGLSADDDTPIVMAEFWDAAHSFGRTGKGRLSDFVEEMRRRGYNWYLVISHEQGGAVSYYCNQSRTFPDTWGNAVFFRDQALFLRAYNWCEKLFSSRA